MCIHSMLSTPPLFFLFNLPSIFSSSYMSAPPSFTAFFFFALMLSQLFFPFSHLLSHPPLFLLPSFSHSLIPSSRRFSSPRSVICRLPSFISHCIAVSVSGISRTGSLVCVCVCVRILQSFLSSRTGTQKAAIFSHTIFILFCLASNDRRFASCLNLFVPFDFKYTYFFLLQNHNIFYSSISVFI